MFRISPTLDLDCYEALSLDRDIPLRTNILVDSNSKQAGRIYLSR